MPYTNEHAARIENPDKYQKFRRENDKFGEGIHAIWGITDDGTVELQSIRFSADKFSAEEAREWLRKHDYTSSLEPASGGDDEREVREQCSTNVSTPGRGIYEMLLEGKITRKDLAFYLLGDYEWPVHES